MVSATVLAQLFAATSIAAILVAITVMLTRSRGDTRALGDKGVIAFLFHDGQVTDATRPARALLRGANTKGRDLDRLVALLESRFPKIRATLDQIADLGDATLDPVDGGMGQVVLEHWDDVLRVTLTGAGAQSAARVSSDLAKRALEDEVDALRAMADDSPQLMWRTASNGQIIWANAAYMEMTERCMPDSVRDWPPTPIFADLPAVDETAPHTVRLPVVAQDDDAPLWFDVTSQISGKNTLHVAQDVSAMVLADDVQRELMQTLTKTFAGLAIGMAVFDRDRRLVLFNPALGDLTGLRAVELVTAPRIDTFLDLLREHRVLPEPKDYAAWRRDMSALEAASLEGDYVETWNLADGRTFRVTGRPFPNGSIALFIEDISSEMAINRQLKASLRLTRDALDGVQDAVAVFSQDRELVVANVSYRKTWGHLSDIGDTPSLEALCNLWRDECLDSSDWDRLLGHAAQSSGPRTTFTVCHTTGAAIDVSVRHLSDGYLSVAFSGVSALGADPSGLVRAHLASARA